eukprot:1738670-Amphidinium_carterae.1
MRSKHAGPPMKGCQLCVFGVVTQLLFASIDFIVAGNGCRVPSYDIDMCTWHHPQGTPPAQRREKGVVGVVLGDELGWRGGQGLLSPQYPP